MDPRTSAMHATLPARPATDPTRTTVFPVLMVLLRHLDSAFPLVHPECIKVQLHHSARHVTKPAKLAVDLNRMSVFPASLELSCHLAPELMFAQTAHI